MTTVSKLLCSVSVSKCSNWFILPTLHSSSFLIPILLLGMQKTLYSKKKKRLLRDLPKIIHLNVYSRNLISLDHDISNWWKKIGYLEAVLTVKIKKNLTFLMIWKSLTYLRDVYFLQRNTYIAARNDKNLSQKRLFSIPAPLTHTLPAEIFGNF